MSASFSFDVDPARDLVRISISGFFHREDIIALAAARDKAHEELSCPANTHVTLIDVRQLKIQSQETMGAFEALLAAREHRSRRLALVVAQTLARTQVERALASRPGAACFADPFAALAWLIDDAADSVEPLRAAG
jgi:hypothetical protein